MTHNEKVFLIIILALSLISLTLSIYFGLNQSTKNLNTCVNKNLYVINTGKDIKEKFSVNEKSSNIQNFKLGTYNPPMSSNTLNINDWNQLTKDLVSKYNDYDAFVILTDHDTLPYTASALSFTMENLSKPIILTSDEDLEDSLRLASQTKIPEVMIASKDKLLRGCISISSSDREISSPNYPVLNEKTQLKMPTEKFSPKFMDPQNKIVVVKTYPGMDTTDLTPYVHMKDLEGIVLELYGEGTGPTDPEFLKLINTLANKGVVIVGVSQYDDINNLHQADIRLLEAGILPGYDMTTPAAYAKLAFLLGNVEDKKLIGQLMDINFRGEMNIPDINK